MNSKLIINIVIGILSLTAFTSAYSQSILDDYFNGNRDSLVVEATKLIFLPEPTFKPESQNMEADPAVFAEMGFEQVYKTENYTFTTRDNTEIFAYKSPSSSQNTIILIHGVASSAYLYNKTARLLQSANIDNSTGEIEIIQGATHNGVRHNAQSFEFIKHWHSKL